MEDAYWRRSLETIMEDAYWGRLMITRNENTFIDLHTFIVGLLHFWESIRRYKHQWSFIKDPLSLEAPSGYYFGDPKLLLKTH